MPSAAGLPPPLPNNTGTPLLDVSILDSNNSAINGTNAAAAPTAVAATSKDEDDDDKEGEVFCQKVSPSFI
jgi:hypothetical protein